jgi:hypothetical protein
MREERLSGGRPQVIVDDSYNRLPEVDIVVRNVKGGAAKDISFEFSAPVESSDGTVISDLTYFKEGMDFLAPDGETPATGTTSTASYHSCERGDSRGA